jgi:hypothetical protein
MRLGRGKPPCLPTFGRMGTVGLIKGGHGGPPLQCPFGYMENRLGGGDPG